jgi:excisionase family DNA binding protein
MNDKKPNDVDVRTDGERNIGFEPLLTVAQAARLMALKTPTLYGWIEEGKFEGLKIGTKSVRIRPEVVRAFLEAAQKEAKEAKEARDRAA